MAYTANPATYGEMQARIADEVLGGVSTIQITGAIQDAILEYENQRFWFNESRWDQRPLTDTSGFPVLDSGGNPITGAAILTTQRSIEFYPLVNSGTSGAAKTLSQISHFDKLVVLAFNNRYSLVWQTPQWMDDMSVGPNWYALPQFWTLQAEEIRFYPIPDQAYPIYVIGTQRFPTLVNLTDSNPWMREGEQLIRRRAEHILYRTILRNPDMAAIMGSDRDPTSEVGIAYTALRRETQTRGGPTRIRPSSF